MPFSGMTQEQKMQVISEILIQETGGELPDGAIIQTIPAQQRTALLAAMKTAMDDGSVSITSGTGCG